MHQRYCDIQLYARCHCDHRCVNRLYINQVLKKAVARLGELTLLIHWHSLIQLGSRLYGLCWNHMQAHLLWPASRVRCKHGWHTASSLCRVKFVCSHWRQQDYESAATTNLRSKHHTQAWSLPDIDSHMLHSKQRTIMPDCAWWHCSNAASVLVSLDTIHSCQLLALWVLEAVIVPILN